MSSVGSIFPVYGTPMCYCFKRRKGSKESYGGYYVVLYTYIFENVFKNWASLVAQMLKDLPAMQQTQVQSLDQDDPLEKGMATHSSILAWRIR